MKKRVKRFNRRDNRNRTIIIGLIILILIAIAIYFIAKNITGNAITGFAVSDDSKIYAKAVKSSYGAKCLSPNKNDGSFNIGYVSKKDYSGISEFDISSLSGKPIKTAEICFAKVNTNNVDFEIRLIAEDSLKCPSDLSGQIILTKTFTERFINGKYFCLDVKDYVVSSLNSNKNSIFVSIAGKRVSKSGSNYIEIRGFDKRNKYTPYLKYELVPCTPDWNCGEWGACSNDIQTKTCTDKNKCGVSPPQSLTQKACFDPKDCSMSGVGMYDFVTNTFYLKNKFKAGAPDIIFKFGNRAGNTKDYYIFGGDTVDNSYFKKNTVRFFTTSINPALFNNIKAFGPLIPIVGDWNGDGIDTVGLFEWDTGKFYLKNSNSAGEADIIFTFNNADIMRDKNIVNRVMVNYPKVTEPFSQIYVYPFAGDWNGDGIDTVAVYDDITKKVYYKNSNSDGDADSVAELEGTYPTSSGDYNGDGKDKVYVQLSEYGGAYQGHFGGVVFNGITYEQLNEYDRYCGDLYLDTANKRAYYFAGSIVGDFNNDGKDEEGLVDLEGGKSVFYSCNSLTYNPSTVTYTPNSADCISFTFTQDIGSDLKAFWNEHLDSASCNGYNYKGYYPIKYAFKFPIAGNWVGCNRIV